MPVDRQLVILVLLAHHDLEPTLAIPNDPTNAARALRLRPVRPEPEYETLTLVVGAASYVLKQLIVLDAQGGTSTFSFSNLRENVGVPDSRFVFTMPKGVDVVTQD